MEMGKTTVLAETNFHYSTEQRHKIRKLRRLLEKNEDLQIGTEDVFLSKFLYHTNWQVKNAFECIHRFYDFKLRHPKWMASNTVRSFRNLLFSTRSRFLMPKADREGRLILVTKIATDNVNKSTNYIFQLIQLDDLIYESLLLLPRVQKHGLTIISDLSGATRSILRIITPTNARLIGEKTNVAPCKRVVHLIQKNFVTKATTSMIIPFVSKELRKKIYSHNGKNFDKLREMVGYENLPAELGGSPGNTLDPQLLYDHMLCNEAYLCSLQAYCKTIDYK